MDCVNSKGLTVALFLVSAVNFPLHFLGRKIFIYVPIITADNLDTDTRGALLHLIHLGHPVVVVLGKFVSNANTQNLYLPQQVYETCLTTFVNRKLNSLALLSTCQIHI